MILVYCITKHTVPKSLAIIILNWRRETREGEEGFALVNIHLSVDDTVASPKFRAKIPGAKELQLGASSYS